MPDFLCYLLLYAKITGRYRSGVVATVTTTRGLCCPASPEASHSLCCWVRTWYWVCLARSPGGSKEPGGDETHKHRQREVTDSYFIYHRGIQEATVAAFSPHYITSPVLRPSGCAPSQGGWLSPGCCDSWSPQLDSESACLVLPETNSTTDTVKLLGVCLQMCVCF